MTALRALPPVNIEALYSWHIAFPKNFQIVMEES